MDQHTNKFSSAVINAHPRRTFSDGDDWQSEFELPPFQEYCATVYVAMKRIQRRHAAVHWRDVDNGLMPKDARITIGMIRQELKNMNQLFFFLLMVLNGFHFFLMI